MIDPGFLSRKLKTGFPLAVRLGENIEYVNTVDVLAVRSKAGKTYAFLPDREVQTVKSFRKVAAYLQSRGRWVEIGRGFLVNLDRLRRSEPAPKGGGFLLTFDTGASYQLLSDYEETVKKALKVESLQYISPLSWLHYFLMQKGIKDLDKNILYMTREELFQYFGTANQNAVVVSVLIANFLWQQVNYIRAGNPSPVDGGNVRSLWYLVKPVLSRLDILDESDHYKTLSVQMSDMVTNRIFSYKEFGLAEDGKWHIGAFNPHVVIMAEKEAHYRFLQQMQDLTGASIIATGGQPSTITSEFFTDALKKALSEAGNDLPLAVLSLTDYDPFGWALLDTHIGDLKSFGFKNPQLINLSVPKNYKPEELDMMHYDLEKSGDTPPSLLRKWMKKTNGIDGKPWGMEVDVLLMDRARVKNLILEEGKPFFKVPPPAPTKFWKETEKFQNALFAKIRNQIFKKGKK